MGDDDEKKDGAEEKKEEKADEGGENGAKDEVIENLGEARFSSYFSITSKRSIRTTHILFAQSFNF